MSSEQIGFLISEVGPLSKGAKDSVSPIPSKCRERRSSSQKGKSPGKNCRFKPAKTTFFLLDALGMYVLPDNLKLFAQSTSMLAMVNTDQCSLITRSLKLITNPC